MEDFRKHIQRAVELSGSQVKLAEKVGCSQQYISWLLKDAGQISPRMAIAFERAGVSRHDLCPDIFGPAPAERAGT